MICVIYILIVEAKVDYRYIPELDAGNFSKAIFSRFYGFIIYSDFDFKDHEEIANIIDWQAENGRLHPEFKPSNHEISRVTMKGNRVLSVVKIQDVETLKFLALCIDSSETFIVVPNSIDAEGALNRIVNESISKNGYFSGFQLSTDDLSAIASDAGYVFSNVDSEGIVYIGSSLLSDKSKIVEALGFYTLNNIEELKLLTVDRWNQ
ncbi:hypothetical protein [Pseudoteredinibacter isoporae]|uniref:hypothetical protein n=1 Tax=Pseudoteredinibacter isoporae TaxID=570281 RepID=UPI003103371A